MRFWENIANSLKERKGEFDGLNEKQLTKALNRVQSGQSVNISKPSSWRTQTGTGEDIGLTSGLAHPVDSTAVSTVRYDPENEVATIQFTSSDQEYDYQVSPSEMREFLTAPSKGQWVNSVWKYNNRMPGY